MISKITTIVAIFIGICNLIEADVYMHNPRGSSDRNCERNVNRNNGNRLFNSQNNNNGGYACPRAVGDESFQNEAGEAYFNILDTATGDVTTFNQSKRMYYYTGSILPIEWTNQHGCGGNSKVTCEIVLQYACEDTLDPKIDDFWPWVTNKAENGSLYRGKQHFRDTSTALGNIAAPRDGIPIDSNDAATDTINDDEADAIPNTPTTRRYGMQESYDYYQVCQHTERNKGLYTADQQVNRNDRRGTRQNPNGDRHGFECPEERDYYPYWAPTPWIDIAVLTDSGGNEVCYPYSLQCTKRCEYYMNNTMNINYKGYCDVNHHNQTVAIKINSQAWQNRVWYNNKKACVENGFKWYEVSHSDNLHLAPNNFVCAHTQFARVNQLGNAKSDVVVSQDAMQTMPVTNEVVQGVNANRFQWTIPDIPTVNKLNSDTYFTPNMQSAYKSCVLRIRYNISSADFQQWPIDAVSPGTAPMVDHRNNSQYKNDPNTPLYQDPYIYIGPGDDSTKGSQFVSLAVNTNQYGRTFQDRSYVFSIKPLPESSQPASNEHDTPAIDHEAIMNNLKAGGKIYNVNVRGKRGNIVQVYPSVEYDFVPNQLILSENDMVHFQWTGSDYNPRRGCNDAEGGPPDLNTFYTDANADQNSRADRSNVVFMNHMANNVPRDYLGYDHTDTTLTYSQKLQSAMATVLAFAPCSNGSTNTPGATACYQNMMRLAYLNQQSDIGSLQLRQDNYCLTETQLDALNNQDVAENHPLNCAKINAKPYPYYDGGIMTFKQNGYFRYYSSRNNNFSNRQNIGVICVGSNCKVNNATGVLQDTNPEVTGTQVVRSSASVCYTTVDGQSGATANGATSCIVTNSNGQVVSTIVTTETFATSQQDNDAYGDGNAQGCTVLSFYDQSNTTTVEQQLGLAFGLLGVGLFFSWLAYYLYNRYEARKLKDGKFRHDSGWQASVAKQNNQANAAKARPLSQTFALPAGGVAAATTFSMSNPAARNKSPTSSPHNSTSPRSGSGSPKRSFSPVAGTAVDPRTGSGRSLNKSFKPKSSDMI